MKKILASSIVASTLLVGLTACGSSEEGSSSSEESKTITIMSSGVQDGTQGVFLSKFEELVESEYPDVNIETTLLPDDQYYTALKSKLSTGQSPDMFLVQAKKAGANSVEAMAEAGYVEDLSSLENWDSIIDQAKNDMSYDGNPYAVSSAFSILGTWYNKDMFEKYGISTPTNWDEFLAACETLKNAGETPIVMGDKDSFMIQFGMYQIAANQVYPENTQFDDQLYTGDTKFTDEEWVTTISMYKELYDKGYVIDTSLGLGQAQAQQMFVDQNAAMIFDGDFSYSALKNDNFELGFAALPANTTGETYLSASTGAGYAISSTSENVDLLKDIFNEMTDGESELFEAWIGSASAVSSYKDAQISDEVFNDIMPLFEAGKSFYFCNQAWPAGTESEMQSKFSEMIGTGNVTPEEVAEAMQAKFEELSK